VPVHHLHGHLASIHLHDDVQPAPALEPSDWPLISLIVSGGHTSLVLQKVRGAAPQTLGQTIDDAVGEAYDKVAKLLGLGYPGGPIIDRLVQGVPPGEFVLPRPLMDRDGYDFSFSGLKTAVLTQALKITREPHLMEEGVKSRLCAAFQEAASDCLMRRLATAIHRFRPRSVAVVGGVACNTRVRGRLAELGERFGIRTYLPRPLHCTDNAAMIGAAAWEMVEKQPERMAGFDAQEALGLNAEANLDLGAFAR
jgi:N6-L-threonylcarbamoyladenine synthase